MHEPCLQVAWPASYHFADVDRLGAFQLAHLRALGITDPQNWPQAKIAATEQGWNVRLCNLHAAQHLPMCLMLMPRLILAQLQRSVHVQPIGEAAQELAAEYICTAHDIMSRSHHAVFVTHNDFQGTAPNDTTGLIPVWAGRPSRLPQSLLGLSEVLLQTPYSCIRCSAVIAPSAGEATRHVNL